jgi:hypothetical protein
VPAGGVSLELKCSCPSLAAQFWKNHLTSLILLFLSEKLRDALHRRFVTISIKVNNSLTALHKWDTVAMTSIPEGEQTYNKFSERLFNVNPWSLMSN